MKTIQSRYSAKQLRKMICFAFKLNLITAVLFLAQFLGRAQTGTVVAWGDNLYGEIIVPAGLSNVIAVAAGTWHSLALKSDGTVTAWGRKDYGQNHYHIHISHFIPYAD